MNDEFGGAEDGFLGYVIPNRDDDGDSLPNAFEQLVGLDWTMADADGDGYSDGAEYPMAGLQPVGRDPGMVGSCR